MCAIMKRADLTIFFIHLIFFSRQFGFAYAFLKFSKDVELSGYTCPSEHVVFRNGNGISLSQCFFLCVESGNCYGFFHQDAGQCIGCGDMFPKSSSYPTSSDTLFYRAPWEDIISKYVYVPEGMTWHQAQDNCKAKGGSLVKFGSNLERELVETNILQGFGHGAGVWIGAYDDNMDEIFLWSDGTVVNDIFIKWGPTDPDLHDHTEHCVAFLNTNGIWASHDSLCSNIGASVCQLD
ncbi:uncharacterized protein LOC132745451 [Ruditapes philippinarum]|uniref:uncharacterized protein LOC132745451 n=1 Tax=Ruditapes philippinarum TaxID=129788 RepID=UPI00295B077B|nr:uncharacterized protein LOC132745451 [Ruditapes philippinarum]